MFPKDITKWNSNDLMDKIESPEPEDTQGNRLGGLQGPGPSLSSLTQLLHSAGRGGGVGWGTPWALVMVTAPVWWAWAAQLLLCSQHPLLLLQTVCTARAAPSSGWPPVWSS